MRSSSASKGTAPGSAFRPAAAPCWPSTARDAVRDDLERIHNRPLVSDRILFVIHSLFYTGKPAQPPAKPQRNDAFRAVSPLRARCCDPYKGKTPRSL